MISRRDLEANALGVIFGYETIAILLRKTRWTSKVPPLTRLITRHELLEDLTATALKYHFYRHRTGQQ